MMKRTINTIQIVCLGLILLIATPLYASMTLNLSASNPSSFAEKVVPVQTYLPKGITVEHVIDSDGLDVDWDEEREQTYVHKNLTLQAGESVSFEIEIEDIWLFTEGYLIGFRDKANGLVAKLSGTDYADKAGKLQAEIEGYLNEVRQTQENALVFRAGPIEHISAYEINKETIALIEENLAELDQLVRIAGEAEVDRQEALRQGKPAAERLHTQEVKEQLLSIDESGEGTGCLVEITMDGETKPINFNAPKTTSFDVVIENPSKLEPKTVPVRYYLTKEIKGRDVVDTGGLKIGFDFERELYYVHDKGILLEPGEKKVFPITLKNRWTISKQGIFASKVYLESMLRAATNASEEIQITIQDLEKEAIAIYDELIERGEMEQLSGSRLESFRDDKDKYNDLERLIREIEDLLLQAGISPADSLIEQEEYCVKAKAEGLSKEEMEEGLREATVLETQRIKSLAGTIFKGKSISGASTFKIINYIIAFLGLLSSIFYFVNIRQQKSTMFDPLTGAFSRAYILDRFREEIRIAKGGKTKCSLLVMDVDKFKGINDTHGHAVGDTILKEFVIAMRKGVRATDLIGRFGGDEFIIVLPTSEKAIAKKIAAGINKVVESNIVTISPKLSLGITTSIGVATYPDDSGTADDVFNKADQALYEVKKKGGNGVVAFGEEGLT